MAARPEDSPRQGDRATTKKSTQAEFAGGLAVVFWSVLRWIVLIAFITTHPGFDVIRQTASELGQQGAPDAWLFNLLNFYVGGALVLVFAAGLRQALKPTRSGLVASALMVVVAISLALPGYFSLPSPLHIPVSVPFFIGAPIAALFASYALGNTYRKLRIFSWFVAIAWLTTTVIGIALQNYGLPAGLYQRLVEVPSTLWFLVFGLWMLRSRGASAHVVIPQFASRILW